MVPSPHRPRTPNSRESAPRFQSGCPVNELRRNGHDAAPACIGASTVIGSCLVAMLLTHTRVAPDTAAPTSVATKASVDRLPEPAGKPARRATPPKLRARPATLAVEKRSSRNAKMGGQCCEDRTEGQRQSHQRGRQLAEPDVEEQGRDGGIDCSQGQSLAPGSSPASGHGTQRNGSRQGERDRGTNQRIDSAGGQVLRCRDRGSQT